MWNGTNGKVNITNSTFSKNTAMLKDHSLQQGGAITNGGEMTITGSTFEDNTANKRGGAIFNSGTLTVNGGSFDGNKAGNGGAIYNATNATLKITGTSFTNNTAAGWGALSSTAVPPSLSLMQRLQTTSLKAGRAVLSAIRLKVRRP